MATKHGKMVTHHDGLPPINSHNSLKHVFTKGHVTLKIFYFLHHNAYVRMTYHHSEVTQGAPTQKFACPHNEVVMPGYVAN